MVGRYLRIAAVCAFVVYGGWEIASEPPLLVLLLALVAALGLTIDSFIDLPSEVQKWKAEEAARGHRRPKWPRVPWGLDPYSLPISAAIGLATKWWIGLTVWLLLTALLWAGWMWTDQFAGDESRLSPRAKRVVTVGFYTLHLGSMALVFVLATVKWGDSGFLAALLGYGAWGFLGERLATGRVAGWTRRAKTSPR